jgi:hypothetical protein
MTDPFDDEESFDAMPVTEAIATQLLPHCMAAMTTHRVEPNFPSRRRGTILG